jgi:Domain of unknown function (DUF929)
MGRESNKKKRQNNAETAREKAAAARAEQRRAEQRRRAFVILGSVVAIVVVAAVVAVVALNHKSTSKPTNSAAPAVVVKDVSSVSNHTLAKVGAGTVIATPAPVTGEPPLTSGGKPEVLYIGAEFCPYCAVERWALAEALSKFGTLSGIGETRSGTTDGNYASLDFKDATYASKYLTFTPVENQDRDRNPLQPVTSAQKALWYKLTNNQPGFPFIDFGNKLALTTTPPLDPSVLGTLNQQQIAAQLNDPNSKIAQTVSGGANDDIAAMCTMTNNQPSSVCNTPTISALQQKMNANTAG